jgi:hypothetical protein
MHQRRHDLSATAAAFLSQPGGGTLRNSGVMDDPVLSSELATLWQERYIRLCPATSEGAPKDLR